MRVANTPQHCCWTRLQRYLCPVWRRETFVRDNCRQLERNKGCPTYDGGSRSSTGTLTIRPQIRVVTHILQADFEATSLRQGVKHLSQLDPSLRIFGASGHKYGLTEPASPTTVLEIEQTYHIELPSDYRFFMLSISDGGAGPNYGIKPISQFLGGCDPGKPFDFKDCCGPNPSPGMIWLSNNGCATSTNLIVNGVDNVGKICHLDCEDGLVTIGSTFQLWYLGWLNGAIRMLVKEPITKKVKKGMKLDEVRGLLGNEMVRHEPRQTLLDDYFLSFPDVNGAVQFDFSDRVKATHFAPHCLTPRGAEIG